MSAFFPLFNFLESSVGPRDTYQNIRKYAFVQGGLSDLFVESKSGESLNCHTVIVLALNPFVKCLLYSGDKIILPDFETAEICSLMNFLYTGK